MIRDVIYGKYCRMLCTSLSWRGFVFLTVILDLKIKKQRLFLEYKNSTCHFLYIGIRQATVEMNISMLKEMNDYCFTQMGLFLNERIQFS